MDTQGNGLTLEALAQRLEALEHENTDLRSKVATLEGSGTGRHELAEKRGSETRRSGDREAALAFDGQVSRRSLLSKAGAAAVAAVAAGTLLNPREAKASDGTFDHIWCKGPITTDTLFASTSNPHFAVHAENRGSGPGVQGKAAEGTGVEGIANAITGAGVEGRANGGLGTGVRGTGGFIGVDGIGNVGVRGTGTDERQAGVKGEGPTGVWGKSSKTGYSGVYGQHTGSSGYGVVGDGKGEAHAGVLGRNQGGTGVHGQSSKTGYGAITAEHTGTSGYGVIGLGTGPSAGVLGRSGSGYGGQFEGGKAQLKLKPAASAGAPGGAHAKGEIYMDSAGTLFVCVAGGNPAEWKRLSATAV